MSCNEKKIPCNKCDKGCLPKPEGLCLEYTGPETTFLKIPTGLGIDDIIQGFDTVLQQMQNDIDESVTEVLTENSPSIILNGNGSTNNELKGFVKLSSQSGQTLQLLSDGLYNTGSGDPGGNDATFTDEYFDL